ncbi:MipA/OmpV family protein [Roseateles depolymerans]|uniref:MipA/OmpV family protein n=1 Tax=Roseateles depolymerans TaxID=76731 RepID=UPI00073D88A4|nr:MipA/OmpV family protein [Roseateles depolymerans]
MTFPTPANALPRLLRLPLLCAGVLASATSSWAAGSLVLMDAPPAESTWSGGVSTRSWPSAPGSRARSNDLLPAVEYLAPSGAFVSTDLGVGWNLVPLLADAEAAKTWQAGARLWPQFGRPSRVTPQGIDRLGSRITTEAFANVQATSWLLLQSGASWGSGRHHDGQQLELGMTSGIPIGDDLIGVTLATTFANAAHLRSSYGIGPREALASGLPEWHPRAGMMDWSIALNGEHKFSSRWSISGQWLDARLVGDAAHSPLTKAKSQQTFSASLWYRF